MGAELECPYGVDDNDIALLSIGTDLCKTLDTLVRSVMREARAERRLTNARASRTTATAGGGKSATFAPEAAGAPSGSSERRSDPGVPGTTCGSGSGGGASPAEAPSGRPWPCRPSIRDAESRQGLSWLTGTPMPPMAPDPCDGAPGALPSMGQGDGRPNTSRNSRRSKPPPSETGDRDDGWGGSNAGDNTFGTMAA